MVSVKAPGHDGSDFIAAKAKWDAADRAFRSLLTKRETMAMALAMARETDEDRTRLEHVAAHLKLAREAARQYLPLALRRPDRLREQIKDLDNEIEDRHPVYIEAREDWEHAKSVETTRVALGLRDRQRVIVKRIAGSLSALSQEIANADELQNELYKSAPNPTSAHLDSVTRELAQMALGNWASAANQWVRRMKAAGFISD